MAWPVEGFETPMALLPRPPSSPAAVNLFSDAKLFGLRQRMLEAMDSVALVDQLYLDGVQTVLRGRCEERTHFLVMAVSWGGRAQASRDGTTDCHGHLREIARRSPFSSTRVLADTYSLWYSRTSIREARTLEDFKGFAANLHRALTEVSVRPGICQMFIAELFQVSVEFIALTMLAGHAEDMRASFPLYAFNAAGRRLEAQQGITAMANLLWQWAFDTFYREGCYYDAVALCCEMLLISGFEGGSKYVTAMREAIARIEAPEVRGAFDRHLGEIGSQLARTGRITPEMTHLARVFNDVRTDGQDRS